LKALLVMSLLTAGSAAAQETNEVFLDATYLGAPTDWCPADAGVPVDGPNIVEVSSERPKTLRVRRGTSIETFHFGSKRFDETAPVIGRFYADLRMCQNPWEEIPWAGSWRVTRSDGTEIESGDLDNFRGSFNYHPVKTGVVGHKLSMSELEYSVFGDRVIFTKGRPEYTFTQTFAAEAEKE
jgi:hypothetical protein